MVRAWIILSTLTLGVLFRLYADYGEGVVGFPFSERTLNTQSYIYYFMEHLIAIAIACCLIIRDNTPIFLFRVFISILILDFLHYILFFRDDGIGFNLIKVIIFSLALVWIHWKRSAET